MTETPETPLTDTQKQLVTANLGLVYDVASRLAERFRVDHDEAVQGGFLALIRSAKAYRPDPRCKFSSYAWTGIERAVIDLAIKARKERWESLASDDESLVAKDRDPAADEDEVVDHNEFLGAAVASLPGPYQDIVRRFYGFGQTRQSLRVIARIYHVRTERIRLKVKRALVWIKLKLEEMSDADGDVRP